MSQGTITLVPVGGLANRMKAMDAAYHLAKDCGSKLKVIWFKDKGLNCRFDQLFQHPTDSIITIREATFCDLILEDRPRKKNFFLPWLPEHLKYDACIYEQQATLLFYDRFDYAAWARNRRVYLASCVYFHPQPDDKLFKLFKPIASLQQRIDACSEYFNEHTIGIHIRRTDNIASITQSPTELFIKQMEEIVEHQPDTTFYLATDSEEEKQTLRQAFGNRIITSPHAAERHSLSGMQEALIELYMLSRTSRIIGSMQSSYSETAAQIGRIQCEFINKAGI